MRERLSNRRRNETCNILFEGFAFTLTIGYDDAGAAKEIFADGVKEGAALAHLLADACVVVSIALQWGVPPAELGYSLGEVPDLARGEEATRPASALGAMLAELQARAEIPGIERRNDG